MFLFVSFLQRKKSLRAYVRMNRITKDAAVQGCSLDPQLPTKKRVGVRSFSHMCFLFAFFKMAKISGAWVVVKGRKEGGPSVWKSESPPPPFPPFLPPPLVRQGHLFWRQEEEEEETWLR